MQDLTVAYGQSDGPTDNVRMELEASHDPNNPNNPYFTPLVRESKRTNFENAQLKMGHMMDERYRAEFALRPQLLGSAHHRS
jgi:hypothetical protein